MLSGKQTELSGKPTIFLPKHSASSRKSARKQSDIQRCDSGMRLAYYLRPADVSSAIHAGVIIDDGKN